MVDRLFINSVLFIVMQGSRKAPRPGAAEMGGYGDEAGDIWWCFLQSLGAMHQTSEDAMHGTSHIYWEEPLADFHERAVVHYLN